MSTAPPPGVRAAARPLHIGLVVLAAAIAVMVSLLVWGFHETYGGGGWLRGGPAGLFTGALTGVICAGPLRDAGTPRRLRRAAAAAMVLGLVGPVVAGLVAPTPF